MMPLQLLSQSERLVRTFPLLAAFTKAALNSGIAFLIYTECVPHCWAMAGTPQCSVPVESRRGGE